MSITAYNLIKELRVYLATELDCKVFINTNPDDDELDFDGNTGQFETFIVITNLPAYLPRSNMRAGGNKASLRRVTLFVNAVGAMDSRTGEDAAGELLEEACQLIDFSWKASDSTMLYPINSPAVDTLNRNTMTSRAVRSAAYQADKNLPVTETETV